MNIDKTDEAIEDVMHALELMLKYKDSEVEDSRKIVQLKVQYIVISMKRLKRNAILRLIMYVRLIIM